MDVLERIDTLRMARGWSINRLALEAMLTQSTLNNLYTRKTEPKLSTLRALCQALGISLAEFFASEGNITENDKKELSKIKEVSAVKKESTKNDKPNNRSREKELLNLISALSEEQVAALAVILKAINKEH